MHGLSNNRSSAYKSAESPIKYSWRRQQGQYMLCSMRCAVLSLPICLPRTSDKFSVAMQVTTLLQMFLPALQKKLSHSLFLCFLVGALVCSIDWATGKNSYVSGYLDVAASCQHIHRTESYVHVVKLMLQSSLTTRLKCHEVQIVWPDSHSNLHALPSVLHYGLFLCPHI